MENDEAIYSYAVDGILATGDWLNPPLSPFDGHTFLEKPPLKFWIVAAPIRLGLLPHNELGMRVWDVAVRRRRLPLRLRARPQAGGTVVRPDRRLRCCSSTSRCSSSTACATTTWKRRSSCATAAASITTSPGRRRIARGARVAHAAAVTRVFLPRLHDEVRGGALPADRARRGDGPALGGACARRSRNGGCGSRGGGVARCRCCRGSSISTGARATASGA